MPEGQPPAPGTDWHFGLQACLVERGPPETEQMGMVAQVWSREQVEQMAGL